MTIPFIIRDDDLCYFTNPEELNSIYHDIWNEFPITFATVPFQKGTFAGHIPLKYWHSKKIYPIGDNKELVNFIKVHRSKKNIDLVLHGIHHTYNIKRFKIIPELVNFKDDFNCSLKEAKEYLDDLFGVDINIFVPPSNTMGKEISKTLIRENWNLLNYPGIRRNTRSLISIRHQYARIKRLIHFLIYKIDMTNPLVWKNRWEIGAHTLTPSTDLGKLKKAFLLALNRNHPFLMATHYWEHKAILPDNPSKTQYDLLIEFLDFIKKYNIKPITANDLKI